MNTKPGKERSQVLSAGSAFGYLEKFYPPTPTFTRPFKLTGWKALQASACFAPRRETGVTTGSHPATIYN
jgi:hypothetical protein